MVSISIKKIRPYKELEGAEQSKRQKLSQQKTPKLQPLMLSMLITTMVV